MRIILLKSLITPHAKYYVGTVLNYSDGPAKRLIKEGKALKYTGPYPPKKKMKFKFSNDGNH